MILCQRNIPQNGGILCPEVPLDDSYSNLMIPNPPGVDFEFQQLISNPPAGLNLLVDFELQARRARKRTHGLK
jgi:hypothetical protein